ncbi:LytTR family DNA-binding domain-containing protein, partial [Flavobacteriales bacterium]|nr:LytTR family DNA-binding domain-containing protein [Flavobacteriales bacterium]
TISIVGEAEGVVSGAKLIREVNPDLVFLDIQMPDGTGFDLLEITGTDRFKVIFTTASDEYAIKAFKFSAVDYLMKPIDPDELISAVDKSINNSHKGSIEILQNTMRDGSAKRIALNTQEKTLIKEISEIVRCESSVNYTMFYFSDGTRLLVTQTLKNYDDLLSPYDFLRVHQSHLINSKFVKEYNKSDGGYLVLKDNSTVPVSTRRKNVVMEMIAKL